MKSDIINAGWTGFKAWPRLLHMKSAAHIKPQTLDLWWNASSTQPCTPGSILISRPWYQESTTPHLYHIAIYSYYVHDSAEFVLELRPKVSGYALIWQQIYWFSPDLLNIKRGYLLNVSVLLNDCSDSWFALERARKLDRQNGSVVLGSHSHCGL